ncbi:hypothetical protein QBC43DRAFT_300408 [Cladorrhinum sp. PSN259]|nr:hypothetical protein QBC43DRAFT_300408 [Cladorrhinum sp. PSN259]
MSAAGSSYIHTSGRELVPYNPQVTDRDESTLEAYYDYPARPPLPLPAPPSPIVSPVSFGPRTPPSNVLGTFGDSSVIGRPWSASASKAITPPEYPGDGAIANGGSNNENRNKDKRNAAIRWFLAGLCVALVIIVAALGGVFGSRLASGGQASSSSGDSSSGDPGNRGDSSVSQGKPTIFLPPSATFRGNGGSGTATASQ